MPRDSIERKLPALNTKRKAIQSALYSDDTLFNGGHPNLEVAHVLGQAIELFVDPAKIEEDDVVRFVRHRAPYSAASMIGRSGDGLSRSSWPATRSSITGRKCRISPCTGHAAASPRAQMVCPSTW